MCRVAIADAKMQAGERNGSSSNVTALNVRYGLLCQQRPSLLSIHQFVAVQEDTSTSCTDQLSRNEGVRAAQGWLSQLVCLPDSAQPPGR